MEYKVFDDYITLQALLKETGIIQSGGAIKTFLSEYPVLFNGERENRRGKKLRVNDTISLPKQGIEINLTGPSQEEILQHQKEIAEKKRVAELVKAMNKDLKKAQTSKKEKRRNTGVPKKQKTTKSPVRFPGI